VKNIVVITGAPGAGKSSIIAELQKRGYNCLFEENRILIKELEEMGSSALPWKDPLAFDKMLLQRQEKQYISAPEGLSFFDRSFVDNIGYLKSLNLSVPTDFFLATDRYRFSKLVFFAEPWQEIYTVDSERKESFVEALKVSIFISQAYTDAGYELVIIPKAPVPQRADFILERLGLPKTAASPSHI
jgi:predicted ATPase